MRGRETRGEESSLSLRSACSAGFLAKGHKAAAALTLTLDTASLIRNSQPSRGRWEGGWYTGWSRGVAAGFRDTVKSSKPEGLLEEGEAPGLQ